MSLTVWLNEVANTAGTRTPRSVVQTHPPVPRPAQDFSFHENYPQHIGEYRE